MSPICTSGRRREQGGEEPRAGRDHHDGHGQEGGERDPSLVGERVPAIDQREAGQEPTEGHRCDERARAPDTLAHGSGDDERGRRAEQQTERVGVGLEVDRRGVHRAVPPRHQGDRHAGAGDGQHEQPAPAQRAHSQERRERQRPHQVELLLDREAPQMLKRARRAELGEVVRALRGEMPVREVTERGESIAGERVQLDRVGPGCAGPEGHDAEQHQQGGEQTTGSARPEAAEPDSAVGPVLAQQERGDEEPGDDEEDVNAEEAPGEPRGAGVEHDHG